MRVALELSTRDSDGVRCAPVSPDACYCLACTPSSRRPKKRLSDLNIATIENKLSDNTERRSGALLPRPANAAWRYY
jgi:hypothetical protein